MSRLTALASVCFCLLLLGCAEMEAIDQSVRDRDAYAKQAVQRRVQYLQDMDAFQSLEGVLKVDGLKEHNRIMDAIDACQEAQYKSIDSAYYGSWRYMPAGEPDKAIARDKLAAKERYDQDREKQKRNLALQELKWK